MSQESFSEEELVEVSIQISMTQTAPPPGLALAEAIRNAILQQDWAAEYPAVAEDLCSYIANDATLRDLLEGYPDQASWDAITTRIQELINGFPEASTLGQLETSEVEDLDEFWRAYDEMLFGLPWPTDAPISPSAFSSDYLRIREDISEIENAVVVNY